MSERPAKVRVTRRRPGTPPAATGPEVDAPSTTAPSAASPSAASPSADPEARTLGPVDDVAPSSELGTSAAGLVSALWRLRPPDAWAVNRDVAAEAGLRATLMRLAETADGVSGGTSVAPSSVAACTAAQLLADTARAVVATFGDQPTAAGPLSDTTLASPVRQRLARLERWLAARAAADPTAEPAADLCLWVLEHLEGGAG